MEGITPQGAGAVLVVASAEDCTGNVTVPPLLWTAPKKELCR